MPGSPVCMDASFLIRLLESSEHHDIPVQLWATWHEAGRLVAAPALLYYEVTNALRRYVIHGVLLPQEAVRLLDIALRFEIAIYEDADLHRRALKLAEALSLPATCDAHYLALAERLNAEFWTADRRLAQAAQKALPWVRWLGERGA